MLFIHYDIILAVVVRGIAAVLVQDIHDGKCLITPFPPF
jgi:hypothetical protein